MSFPPVLASNVSKHLLQSMLAASLEWGVITAGNHQTQSRVSGPGLKGGPHPLPQNSGWVSPVLLQRNLTSTSSPGVLMLMGLSKYPMISEPCGAFHRQKAAPPLPPLFPAVSLPRLSPSSTSAPTPPWCDMASTPRRRSRGLPKGSPDEQTFGTCGGAGQ